MPSEGEIRRDDGMERVRRKSDPWWTWACFLLNNIEIGWQGRPEEAYAIVINRIGHPNNWGINYRVLGALWMRAVENGWFEQTGVRQHNLVNAKNNKCVRDVYVRTSIRPYFKLPWPLPPPPEPLEHKAAAETPAERFIRAFEPDA